ncbi:MAG TPA: response regulator [Terriglobales bacterium]|nr:response regulator [Terriglobales bacterium]
MKSHRTLLLIESGLSLKDCKTALEQSGYAVLTARSSRQGLKLLQSLSVDAVLLDGAAEAKRNGSSVAARVRKQNPSVRILMTGTALPERALYLADGFIDNRNRPEFFPMLLDRLLRREKRAHAA